MKDLAVIEQRLGGVFSKQRERPIMARNKSSFELGDRKSFVGIDSFKKETTGRDMIIGATVAQAQVSPF